MGGTPMLKVGDKVTTRYKGEEEKVVRTIILIEKFDSCESGYLVSLDGGEECPHCGHGCKPITRIDMGWCVLVKKESTKKKV